MTCPFRFSSFMMGAASKSTSMEYVPSAPESSKVPIAPMGKLLTRLPRLTLAQLRTLRSSTGCTCCRDLAKFPSPPWETHVLLVFTGRRCLCLFRHRHNDVLLNHRQHSFWIGACSCSKLPIAPMGKCLVDMSIRFSSLMMWVLPRSTSLE